MSLHQYILTSMRRAAEEVFATMVGMELSAAEEKVESGSPESTAGVVSFIGVAGAWAGTGSLTCSPLLACRISSRMLVTDISAIDEDVLDAIAELTNMIIGSVKNDLELRVGPLGLSIPTVVYGRNFHTRSASVSQWHVVRFPFDEEELIVKLCVAPLDRRIGEPAAAVRGRHQPHGERREKEAEACLRQDQ